MASDNIYVVTDENVEGWSGDHLTTVMEYVKEVFGSDYEFNEWRGYDTSGANANSLCELKNWWGNQSFTDSDRNLLIVSAEIWGAGGCASNPGHAAVSSIYDGMVNMAGPSADPDLIGDQPVTGYAAPAQIAIALQEIAHMFAADHDEGIADNHDSVNFTSPMLASYADGKAGTDNECGRKIEHDDLNENRYVEGYSKCAVNNSNFNHTPQRTYTKDDIETL